MLPIAEINKKDVQICFDFDSSNLSLWSRRQWADELKKEGTKVYGLFFSDLVVGLCVFQIVLDEGQIIYFSVDEKFRRNGFGTYLMKHIEKQCEELKLKKLLLEVSENNFAAVNFYSRFDFFTVGMRKNYYKDSSNALLKEKKIIY